MPSSLLNPIQLSLHMTDFPTYLVASSSRRPVTIRRQCTHKARCNSIPCKIPQLRLHITIKPPPTLIPKRLEA